MLYEYLVLQNICKRIYILKHNAMVTCSELFNEESVIFSVYLEFICQFEGDVTFYN